MLLIEPVNHPRRQWTPKGVDLVMWNNFLAKLDLAAERASALHFHGLAIMQVERNR